MLSVYVALDDIGDRYGKSVFNDNDFAMINETAITKKFDVFSDPSVQFDDSAPSEL